MHISVLTSQQILFAMYVIELDDVLDCSHVQDKKIDLIGGYGVFLTQQQLME